MNQTADAQQIDKNQHPAVALIVGASSGLGRALALELADRYHLVLLASSSARLEETDDLLRRQSGQSATLVAMNLENHDEIDAVVAGLWQRFGRLDLLCLCAANTTEATPLAHLAQKDFDKMLNVNLSAPFRILRACDAILRHTAHAQIAAITGRMSADGVAPNAFTAGFDASKAALMQLVQSYALELGQTSTRAFTVDPGHFGSRLRRTVFPGQKSANLPDASEKARKIAEIVLNGNAVNAAHYDV